MAADDAVFPIRIPRALYDEIKAWRQSSVSERDVTMAASLRRLLERGLRETKRKVRS